MFFIHGRSAAVVVLRFLSNNNHYAYEINNGHFVISHRRKMPRGIVQDAGVSQTATENHKQTLFPFIFRCLSHGGAV